MSFAVATDYFFERQGIIMAKAIMEAVTPMDEDFARWYTDVVLKTELRIMRP
jgi:hypothetical protein